jgi:hypothetical protein
VGLKILVTESKQFIPDDSAPQEVEFDRDGTISLVDFDWEQDDLMTFMTGQKSPKRRLYELISADPVLFLVSQNYISPERKVQLFEESLRHILNDARGLLPGRHDIFDPYIQWLDGKWDHVPSSMGIYYKSNQAIKEMYGSYEIQDDRFNMSTYIGAIVEVAEKLCGNIETIRTIVEQGDDVPDSYWFMDEISVIAKNIDSSCQCVASRPCGSKATAENARLWMLNRVIDFVEADV